jgi:hypothetical protein
MVIKNASKNMWVFIATVGWDVLIAVLSFIVVWAVNTYTDLNGWIAGCITFVSILLLVFISNILKWAIKAKRGIAIVSPKASERSNEEEKPAWIEIRVRDDFDKIKVYVILKRLSIGFGDDGADLLIGKENKCFASELEVENFPKRIDIASGVEDNVFFYLDEEKVPFKILTPYDDLYLREEYEFVFEINGKINGEYLFSEFYKGNVRYTCNEKPNFFVGRKQKPHRQSMIEFLDLKRWSEKGERLRDVRRKKKVAEERKLLKLGT